MKKFLRILGAAAAILAGLVVVVFLVLKLISDEQYKEWITSAVKSATGRDFTIEKLELELNSSLLVKASDVRLGNAAWGSQPDMLSVGLFEAELDLISLLGGVADVRTVINTTHILAETNTDKNSNWNFDAQKEGAVKATAEEADDGGLPIRPLIREFRILDLNATLLDAATDSQKGANIENLLIETVHDELTLDLAGTYETTAITLTGNLGRVVEALEGASTPVALKGKVGENALDVSGQWGPLLPDPTAELKLGLDAPSTSELTGIAGIELADLGKLKLNAMLTAIDGHYAISELNTTLDGEEVKVSVDGAIADLTALKGIELKSQANTSALAAVLEKFKVDVPVALPTDLTISAQISGDMEKLGVKEINIQARDEGIDVHVSGDVAHALKPEGVAAKVEVNVASVAALSKYAELDIPQLGELKISGAVSSVAKTYRLDDLNARLSGKGINVTVNGAVGDLVARDGIDANIKLDTSTLSPATVSAIEQLLKQQNIDIPPLPPTSVELSSNVTGSMDQLGLTNIEAKIIDEGIELTLSGAVANALAAEGVDATIRFKADTLAALSKYTQPYTQYELPEQGALDLSGRVLSADKTYRLQDLRATLSDDDFNAEIQGSINDLLAVGGINAELKADVASLSALSSLTKSELPATDPVSLTGKVQSGEGEHKQTAVTVSAESDGARVSLDGSLADLKSLDTIDVSLAASASSLSDFNKFAQTELPEQGPFNLTGTAYIRHKEYRLQDLQITLDEQSLSGNAGIKLAEDDAGKSVIDAQLNIPLLDLSHLIASKPEVEQTGEQTETGSDTKIKTKDAKEDEESVVKQTEEKTVEKLFSTDPLPVDKLRHYNAEVAITADRLQLGKTDIREVDIKLSLLDGSLRVEPINAISGDGTIAATFELDASRAPTKLAVDITLKDATMPRFGGGLDFSLDLNGAGDSMAELMGGSNGQILIVMRDARLEKSALTEFGRGLLSNLNPFAKEETYTDLKCGILRMDIKDGKADFKRKLAAQMTEVTWRGGGDINLKTEKLDVGIVPIPKTGFNLSAGSLASLVRVGGTLKDPTTELNPKDVAMKYGKYMAALSTGGLSVLAEGLFNIQQANEDICTKILDGTIFDEQKATERMGTEQERASETEGKIEPDADTGEAVEKKETPASGLAVEQKPAIEKEAKKKSTAPNSKNVQ